MNSHIPLANIKSAVWRRRVAV